MLFWLVCIPLRLYLASLGDRAWLRVFAAAVGLTWLSGEPKTKIGFFGGPAWWADQRPLHGALWMTYAVTGSSDALYLDALVGVFNWFTAPT